MVSTLLASHGHAHAQEALSAPCEHAASSRDRVAACTSLLSVASDRNTQMLAHEQRGLALCGIPGRCAEAVNDFASVIGASPPRAIHFENYARALRAAGRVADADAAASKAAALRPPQSTEEKAADDLVARAYRACWRFDSRLPLKGYIPEIRVRRDSDGALVAPPELLNPTTDSAGQRVAQAALSAVERCDRIPLPNGLGRKFLRRVIRFDPTEFADDVDQKPTAQSNHGKSDLAKQGGSTVPKSAPQTENAYSRVMNRNAEASALIERADGELREGRIDDAIADLQLYPAAGKNADEVRGKLQALRAVRASNAARSSGNLALIPKAAAEPSESCNFYSWTPLQQCIQSYHTENDPLPSGPNPKRWNEKVAAEARTIVAQHPEVTWDRTEWNALVKKDEEDTASIQAEHDFHEEMKAQHPDDKAAEAASSEQEDDGSSPSAAGGGTIAACNAPEVLQTIRELSKTELKNKAFELLYLNAADASFEYVGIRQLSFDPDNEHRVCAMDRKLDLKYMAMTKREPTSTLAPITYEIDRRLDGDRGSYVTCRCRLP